MNNLGPSVNIIQFKYIKSVVFATDFDVYGEIVTRTDRFESS